MFGYWPVLLAGIGIGIVATLAALSRVLYRAYRDNQARIAAERAKEQEERDWSVATKMAAIFADMRAASVADDPDQLPARTGRPSRRADADEALLMKYATVRDAKLAADAALADFEETLIYVKEHHGHPDDRPAQVIRTIEQKGKNK